MTLVPEPVRGKARPRTFFSDSQVKKEKQTCSQPEEHQAVPILGVAVGGGPALPAGPSRLGSDHSASSVACSATIGKAGWTAPGRYRCAPPLNLCGPQTRGACGSDSRSHLPPEEHSRDLLNPELLPQGTLMGTDASCRVLGSPGLPAAFPSPSYSLLPPLGPAPSPPLGQLHALCKHSSPPPTPPAATHKRLHLPVPSDSSPRVLHSAFCLSATLPTSSLLAFHQNRSFWLVPVPHCPDVRMPRGAPKDHLQELPGQGLFSDLLGRCSVPVCGLTSVLTFTVVFSEQRRENETGSLKFPLLRFGGTSLLGKCIAGEAGQAASS